MVSQSRARPFATRISAAPSSDPRGGRTAGAEETQIEAARRIFYEGFVAEADRRRLSRSAIDSSGERHAGLLMAATLPAGGRARAPNALHLSGRHGAKTRRGARARFFCSNLAQTPRSDLKAMGFLSPTHSCRDRVRKLAFAVIARPVRRSRLRGCSAGGAPR